MNDKKFQLVGLGGLPFDPAGKETNLMMEQTV